MSRGRGEQGGQGKVEVSGLCRRCNKVQEDEQRHLSNICDFQNYLYFGLKVVIKLSDTLKWAHIIQGLISGLTHCCYFNLAFRKKLELKTNF
jgi:hypothetical protein